MKIPRPLTLDLIFTSLRAQYHGNISPQNSPLSDSNDTSTTNDSRERISVYLASFGGHGQKMCHLDQARTFSILFFDILQSLAIRIYASTCFSVAIREMVKSLDD